MRINTMRNRKVWLFVTLAVTAILIVGTIGCSPKRMTSKTFKTEDLLPPILPAAPDSARDMPALQAEESMTTYRVDDRWFEPDIDYERFTVYFEDAEIRSVLMAMAQKSGYDIVLEGDVQGKVSLRLHDATLTEILSLSCEPMGLEFSRKDRFIKVYRPKVETRIYNVDYIITRREGLSELVVRGQRANLNTYNAQGQLIVSGNQTTEEEESLGSISSTSDSDLWHEIVNGLGIIMFGSPAPSSAKDKKGAPSANTSMSDEKGRCLVINKQANKILISDYPKNHEKIDSFLMLIEESIQRQVLITAKIVEVRLFDNYATGLDWASFKGFGDFEGTLSGGAVASQRTLPANPSGNFQFGVQSKDVSVMMDMMANQGELNVLSTPKISTLNNQKAIIKVVTEDVYFASSPEQTIVTSGVVTKGETLYTGNIIPVGIVLDVTPQISSDGVITMNIHQNISDVVGEKTSPNNDTLPIINKRETDSVVRIHDNETLVIAGLLQDKVDQEEGGIPILSDMPLFGPLFQRTQKDKYRTELVILLTPTIVTRHRARVLTEKEIKNLRESDKDFFEGWRPWEDDNTGSYWKKK